MFKSFFGSGFAINDVISLIRDMLAQEIAAKMIVDGGIKYGEDILFRALPRGVAKGWEEFIESYGHSLGTAQQMAAPLPLNADLAQEMHDWRISDLEQEINIDNLSSIFTMILFATLTRDGIERNFLPQDSVPCVPSVQRLR